MSAAAAPFVAAATEEEVGCLAIKLKCSWASGGPTAPLSTLVSTSGETGVARLRGLGGRQDILS